MNQPSSENPVNPADDDRRISALLAGSSRGDKQASRQFADLLYADLRREAQRQFREEAVSHTLEPTALIHESFLRLLGQQHIEWQNRDHFLAMASQMMRRVLVDHARARLRRKRGGGRRKLSLSADHLVFVDDPASTLAIQDILEKLERFDPRQAQIIELRFFAGLTNEEVARTLHLSLRTIESEWSLARAWLKRELSALDE